MKNTKKEIKGKLLTEEQGNAVKSMIIASMRESYISVGTTPGDGFNVAANQIASKVVEDTQKALLQSNVFENSVKNSKPTMITKKNIIPKGLRKIIDREQKAIRKLDFKNIKKVKKNARK